MRDYAIVPLLYWKEFIRKVQSNDFTFSVHIIFQVIDCSSTAVSNGQKPLVLLRRSPEILETHNEIVCFYNKGMIF